MTRLLLIVVILIASGMRHASPTSYQPGHPYQVSHAELLSTVMPVVPDSLWADLSDTSLILLLCLNESGAVDSTMFIKGEPLLYDSANAAALQWEFRPPMMSDSTTIATSLHVPFVFCPSCPERSLAHRGGVWLKAKGKDGSPE